MKISVIGLGYVGLPLAAALAKHYDVVGYDRDSTRISELTEFHDRTGELNGSDLKAATRLAVSDAPDIIATADVHIVTVPTPVDRANRPDLTPVISACQTVGSYLKQNDIIVFESTVYPGVTEEICGPELEKASGLTCGTDFYLGYSPERINPGDKVHTVEKIIKVVAGQTPEVSAKLAELYGTVITAGIHQAPSIQVAEAAKVIENAQRDINIAFVNEIAMICQKQGISVHDVLEASQTKWNFLPFTPGLVGGHCIGVDPYYMAYRAEELGHHPEIILAGRRLNDHMGVFVADQVADLMTPPGKILALGLTFKENVPDLRNSKVPDVLERLKKRGFQVDVHDPEANPAEAKAFFGVDLIADIPTGSDANDKYDCIICMVPHTQYTEFSTDQLKALLKEDGLVADPKGVWRKSKPVAGCRYWCL